jgi:hypothetical protein
MPRQPQWFQHVPQALEQLRELPAPALDRAALEKLLHVSRRAAIRLLHRFGGYQAGRTFLIGREELAQALNAVSADEAYVLESRRRQRLSDDLENTRRDLRARQVKLRRLRNPPPPLPCPPACGSSGRESSRSLLLRPRTCWGGCMTWYRSLGGIWRILQLY